MNNKDLQNLTSRAYRARLLQYTHYSIISTPGPPQPYIIDSSYWQRPGLRTRIYNWIKVATVETRTFEFTFLEDFRRFYRVAHGTKLELLAKASLLLSFNARVGLWLHGQMILKIKECDACRTLDSCMTGQFLLRETFSKKRQ